MTRGVANEPSPYIARVIDSIIRMPKGKMCHCGSDLVIDLDKLRTVEPRFGMYSVEIACARRCKFGVAMIEASVNFLDNHDVFDRYIQSEVMGVLEEMGEDLRRIACGKRFTLAQPDGKGGLIGGYEGTVYSVNRHDGKTTVTIDIPDQELPPLHRS